MKKKRVDLIKCKSSTSTIIEERKQDHAFHEIEESRRGETPLQIMVVSESKGEIKGLCLLLSLVDSFK